MSKKFDVVAITGKYTDKDGNEKSRYTNIGVVLETSKGLSLKLESIPVGWDGWAGLYEPKPEQGQQRPPQRAPLPDLASTTSRTKCPSDQEKNHDQATRPIRRIHDVDHARTLREVRQQDRHVEI